MTNFAIGEKIFICKRIRNRKTSYSQRMGMVISISEDKIIATDMVGKKTIFDEKGTSIKGNQWISEYPKE